MPIKPLLGQAELSQFLWEARPCEGGKFSRCQYNLVRICWGRDGLNWKGMRRAFDWIPVGRRWRVVGLSAGLLRFSSRTSARKYWVPRSSNRKSRYRVFIKYCFPPKNSRKFATSSLPALGCYWLYKKLPANRSDCTLALRWEVWKSFTAI